MKKPATPPDLSNIFKDLNHERLIEIFTSPLVNTTKKYFHWDELRRRPAPKGCTHEEWWLMLKSARQQLERETPLLDEQRVPFSYSLTDHILEKLPRIDAQAKGAIGTSEQVINSGQRDRYVISSLIEEAITSSQLEGAVTTRKEASDMLRTGRAPRDKSEQMILNNFMAMNKILSFKNETITPEKICELHKVVTEHTLDDESAAGRIQRPSDKRVSVWDETTGDVLHTPPPAEELANRMQSLCDFANAPNEDGQYLHPIIRAIILHFWLAYDHPFEDGNGRTARALFYWSMLKQGYWLFEFVSISSLLRKAPTAYARSYLYTETDGNDLTYFIIYQLEIILRAIKELEKYIERKSQEVKQIDHYIRDLSILNHRQKALAAHALKDSGNIYSIESHQRSHNIAYATSRSDLLKLVELGILQKFKIGKALRFKAVDQLERVLQKIG
mgnify:CR=1 FL=1